MDKQTLPEKQSVLVLPKFAKKTWPVTNPDQIDVNRLFNDMVSGEVELNGAPSLRTENIHAAAA